VARGHSIASVSGRAHRTLAWDGAIRYHELRNHRDAAVPFELMATVGWSVVVAAVVNGVLVMTSE
jgi:hypothetical protein